MQAQLISENICIIQVAVIFDAELELSILILVGICNKYRRINKNVYTN